VRCGRLEVGYGILVNLFFIFFFCYCLTSLQCVLSSGNVILPRRSSNLFMLLQLKSKSFARCRSVLAATLTGLQLHSFFLFSCCRGFMQTQPDADLASCAMLTSLAARNNSTLHLPPHHDSSLQRFSSCFKTVWRYSHLCVGIQSRTRSF
jgi:hypothetical protein